MKQKNHWQEQSNEHEVVLMPYLYTHKTPQIATAAPLPYLTHYHARVIIIIIPIADRVQVKQIVTIESSSVTTVEFLALFLAMRRTAIV